MSEELVQQQLWLGTNVVLGSAVAAGSVVHTGLTGTSPLGDVEPTTVARKSDVACEGCRTGSRDAGDAELRS